MTVLGEMVMSVVGVGVVVWVEARRMRVKVVRRMRLRSIVVVGFSKGVGYMCERMVGQDAVVTILDRREMVYSLIISGKGVSIGRI